MTGSQSGDGARCDCKIGRSIEAYGLRGLDAELVRKREEQGASLRDLAAFVNERILGAALEDANADVAGDAASVYRALTDDEVAPQRQAAVRNQLTDVGIDVDDLSEDFLSYQTVRLHLQDCHDMDTGRSGITTVEEGRKAISRTRERDQQVIERTLKRLHRVDALAPTDIDVSVSVRTRCEACGSWYTVDEYLDAGGCECASPSR